MFDDFDVRIRLTWSEDAAPDSALFTNLREFFADNEELDPEERAALRALQVGEKYTGGGGAAGTWIVERVA
jgi:hypothetical protein